MTVTTDAAAGAAVHHTEHSTFVQAAPEAVYAIVSDVLTWPLRFAPNVHVERLAATESTERIQIWATANGEVRTWISHRVLDPVARRVSFRQEVSSPPVAGMGGEWIITAEGGGTRLVLTHDFSAVGDDPAGVEWITKATDTNSTAELAAVKALAERFAELGELEFEFEDTVEVAGDGADVFEFLYRADEWPRRLPHVAALDLQEDVPGVQVMAMDTTTADGSVHTTKSVRVAFGTERLVYKQTEVPALMTAHTGRWRVTPIEGGVLVGSQHSVTIRPDAVERVLGAGRTVADAREFVHRALSTNSGATLRHAKAFAEARRAERGRG
ncbi:aromatase/cyclase [Kitasatospora sp. NPDC087314]|uniref:aromatase/cyclase n=1 Tax=Kitasatospora sp. NPDC087314 TaxID=3364068 RepID=UPI003805B5E9